MKRTTCFLALCGALVLSTSLANASVLQSMLSPDGITDLIADDSRGALVQATPGPIVQGDIIYGFVVITNYVKSPGTGVQVPPPTLGMVYSATVLSGDGSAGSPWTLGPTAAASAYSLQNLAPDLFNASGATAGQLTNSIFLAGSNPGNVQTQMMTEAGTALQSVKDAADLLINYEATGGIQPGLNSHGGTDFFRATLNATATGIDELGGFTIFDTVFNGVFGTPSVPTLIGPVVQPYDTYLVGTIQGMPSASVYDYDDDARFYTNVLRFDVVPEPVSYLVWGGLAAAGGLVARRRLAS